MQVEVDEHDAQAAPLHRPRQVDRDRRGSDAALGAEDGDDLPDVAARDGHLGVGAHRQAQLLVIALEHELARAGAHRAQDQLGILRRRDDDDDAARGRDVVDQAEAVGRVGPHGDDRGARIQIPILVGDQLGGRLGADDVGDVLERQPDVGLLGVVHRKQQDCWSRHGCPT